MENYHGFNTHTHTHTQPKTRVLVMGIESMVVLHQYLNVIVGPFILTNK